jgi:hypothetical protein
MKKFNLGLGLALACISLSSQVSAEIIDVDGTGIISSLADNNDKILPWDDSVYEKGMEIKFTMRIDTDNFENISYYNGNTREKINGEDGVPPYAGWATRINADTRGSDSQTVQYERSFSAMTVTLPEVTKDDVVLPEITLKHNPISNPFASHISENIKKEADAYGYRDNLYITHVDRVDISEEDKTYTKQYHRLSIAENTVNAFSSADLLENFSYEGGNGTTTSIFEIKDFGLETGEGKSFLLHFKVRSLNWMPVQSCSN